MFHVKIDLLHFSNLKPPPVSPSTLFHISRLFFISISISCMVLLLWKVQMVELFSTQLITQYSISKLAILSFIYTPQFSIQYVSRIIISTPNHIIGLPLPPCPMYPIGPIHFHLVWVYLCHGETVYIPLTLHEALLCSVSFFSELWYVHWQLK